ncbi:MAG TPA: DUF2231 domain-containing protein [Niastella sp.]
MNPTHLHLVITHLPIYGSMLGALTLMYGMAKKSSHTKTAAFYLLLIACVGGIIAYSTGESAEETVKNLQSVNENIIEEHEEIAKLTLSSIIALGLASLAAIMLIAKKSVYARGITIAVLIISLITAGMASWTGYLGGKIRHTETANAVGMIPENKNDH